MDNNPLPETFGPKRLEEIARSAFATAMRAGQEMIASGTIDAPKLHAIGIFADACGNATDMEIEESNDYGD